MVKYVTPRMFLNEENVSLMIASKTSCNISLLGNNRNNSSKISFVFIYISSVNDLHIILLISIKLSKNSLKLA